MIESRNGEGLALLAVTRNGCRTLEHLKQSLPQADVFFPSSFADEIKIGYKSERSERLKPYQVSLRKLLESTFHRYRGWVLILAVGAAVRLLAPLLRGKADDPAVVAADEGGQHVVSLLSAHRGGANQLARETALILGARPVITTASEVQQTVAVDTLGQEWGWTLAQETGMTRLSAAVVNGETIGVIQESGPTNWLSQLELETGRWRFFASCAEARPFLEQAAAWLVITHRLPGEEERRFAARGALYHPKSLCLGVGCSRGTPAAELEDLIRDVLARHRLAFDAIRCLSSITLKSDELGLLELAERYGWTLSFYDADRLNRIPIPHPSDYVYQVTGSHGVSQPAALLSAHADRLLVEKEKSRNATLSIAVYKNMNPEG